MAPTTGTRTSARQGRATLRPTNYYARSFAGRLAASALEQSPDAAGNAPGFVPALSHFTAAVDAFPRDMVRHFSMFNEVEAKLHDPELLLHALLAEIAQQPTATRATAIATTPAAHRRQLFYRLRMLIANILPNLDEKLIVLQGAKATKDKGLVRMHHSFARLDADFSDEARYGSLTHWAYADAEDKKKAGPSNERHRREVAAANNLAAAAQHVHDADARRDAMQPAKRSRQAQPDSDFDERPAKKPQKRKPMPADTAPPDTRHIGLGISHAAAGPHAKRKKTEKAAAAAAADSAAAAAAATAATAATLAPTAPPMERSASGARKAVDTAGRAGSSPRGTPGPDNGIVAKRKPRAAPVPAQRKNQFPTYSPPPTSSPLAASFAISKATTGAVDRTLSARARKNSTTTSATSANVPEPSQIHRPSSAHSAQQVASTSAMAELEQATGVVREDVAKDVTAPQETLNLPQPFDTSAMKLEDLGHPEPENLDVEMATLIPGPARPGRASKTATPVAGAISDVPMARSRSTRNGNTGQTTSNTSSENNSTTAGTVPKRSSKKPSTIPVTKLTPTPRSNPPSSAASSNAEEQDYQEAEVEAEIESDEDGDEPRYCYCNQVSYGNMIACDNDDCPREWFHLPCVQLNKAPSNRTKWFCSDECKDAHAKAKAKGGRPGSSRQ